MSLVVQNLYKLPCNDLNLYENIFQAQKEFRRILEDRTIEVVKENLREFKEFYEGKAKPKTHQQWINVCFKQLIKDVRSQKGSDIRIDSDFIINLSDFLVDVILYKHQTEGYFVQIFGSRWAVNELKTLLHLTENFTFDDRSDGGL